MDWGTLSIQAILTIGGGSAAAAAIVSYANRNRTTAEAEVEQAKRRNTDATTDNQVVETARSLVAGVQEEMVRLRAEMAEIRFENRRLRTAVIAYGGRNAYLETLILHAGIAVDPWDPPEV